MTELKPGDVVRLKGQIINMTVVDVSNEPLVRCVWFTSNGLLRTEIFLPDHLELVND